MLNTASAASSHREREGSMVTRVAAQSRGPRNTHREVTDLQLGSPAICMCVAGCLHMQTNGLLYLILDSNANFSTSNLIITDLVIKK